MWLCEVGHGYGCEHIQPFSGLASAVNWFMRSPPPAAGSPRVRAIKLSVRSCAEGYWHCASAPSGCGCVRRRQSVQSVLPGA